MADGYPQWMKMVIAVFVLIIIGLVFVNILADQAEDARTIRGVTNKSHTLVGGSVLLGNSNLRSLENIITTGLIVNNFTNNSIASNNYQVFVNGSFMLRAGASADYSQGLTPTLNITHTYYSENYVKGSSTAQTLLLLIPLFIVLALLIYVAWSSGVFGGMGFGGGEY